MMEPGIRIIIFIVALVGALNFSTFVAVNSGVDWVENPDLSYAINAYTIPNMEQFATNESSGVVDVVVKTAMMGLTMIFWTLTLTVTSIGLVPIIFSAFGVPPIVVAMITPLVCIAIAFTVYYMWRGQSLWQ